MALLESAADHRPSSRPAGADCFVGRRWAQQHCHRSAGVHHAAHGWEVEAAFFEQGIDGLLDEQRPGTSRKLSDEDVERVLTLTLESKPADVTHWSTRSMAQRTGFSRASIHRIWRAFSLAPHRAEIFKLSRDPLFIDKVRDIVGLYLDPPDRALVLCVDEESQIQALDRTAPLLPMRPGRIERRTHDTSAAAPPASRHARCKSRQRNSTAAVRLWRTSGGRTA